MLNRGLTMINNYYNLQATPAYYPSSNLAIQVNRLGQQTIFSNKPGHFAQFNHPLINQLCQQGVAVIPHLVNFLNATTQDTAIAEAAFLAQKLAQQKTPGYEQLYTPLARHSNHPCPVVQVMIAGAMRDIGEPSAAGPLTRMLYKDLQYPPGYFTFDPTEEIAGSLMELYAQRATLNTMKSLEPRLKNIETKLNIQA